MDADMIILEKEWAQLSDAERAFVAEIAADEASYKRLRAFLLQSAALPGDAPQVPASVKAGLLMELAQQKRPARRRHLWYAAMAAASAVITLTVWLWQQGPVTAPKDPYAIPRDITNIPPPLIPDTIQTIKKETVGATPAKRQSIPATMKKPVQKKEPTAIAHHTKTKPPTTSDVLQPATINTNLSADANLLQLLTAVY
jgi:hypothetical protein